MESGDRNPRPEGRIGVPAAMKGGGGPPFAVRADRLFDGQGVLTDYAVVVAEGAVTAVVPAASVPAGVPVLSHPGATILPGLIDAHIHLMQWEAPLLLAYGVTTVRDVGNELNWILGQRRQAEQGVSPAVLCLGPVLDGPQPCHAVVSRACVSQTDAVAAVREVAAAGADGIKLYCLLPTEWLPAMVEQAHAAGLKASKHCLGDGVLVAGRAGVDEFFHHDGILADVWPDRPPGWLNVWGLPEFAQTFDAQRRVADEIARLGMTATPTLVYWRSQWRIRADDFAPDRDAPHVPAAMLAWQGASARDTGLSNQWRRALEAAQRFTGLLLERGVPVLAGSDVPCGGVTPGLSLWQELGLLVGSGMSPVQALRAATSEAAALLARPRIGRVAPGCVADLVVVRGDPTQAIPGEPDIVTVVRRGEIHRPSELLAQAQAAAATVRDDPWSAQFEAHAARR